MSSEKSTALSRETPPNKSCPFCGKAPGDYDDAGEKVMCETASCPLHCMVADRMAWNHRAAPPDTQRLDHVEEWLDDFQFVEVGDIQRHVRCDWFAGDGGGHWYTQAKTFREAIDKSLNHEAIRVEDHDDAG